LGGRSRGYGASAPAASITFPQKTIDRAQQRLAALLVLIALSSETAPPAAEQNASNEIIDLICRIDLLLTDCRVLDLRELARK
jgi:hypothetical protein